MQAYKAQLVLAARNVAEFFFNQWLNWLHDVVA